MAIKIICPNCQAHFNVSEKFAGTTGPCPKCRKEIEIPIPGKQTEGNED